MTTTSKPNRACQEAMRAYARWLMKQEAEERKSNKANKRFHWIGNRAPVVKH